MDNSIHIPEMTGLTFEEKEHLYYLDGARIPSVTTVMELLSQHEYRQVDTKTLEIAAERGTAVHNSIENWLKFGFDDIDPDYRGYIDGFREWWEIKKPTVIGSETKIFHKIMRYAGTADLIAVIDGELNLVDFKTTYKIIEKNCRVQLEAYAQGLASHGLTVQKKRILHLQKNGKWDDVVFQGKDAEAWRVFGSLKCVFDYTHT